MTRFDLPETEVDRIMLGAITASRIDGATAVHYFAGVMKDLGAGPLDNLTLDEANEVMYLAWNLIGRLFGVLSYISEEPAAAAALDHYIEQLRPS